MNKYINADELKEKLKKDDFDLSYHWSYVQMLIDETPTADVVEAKHGEWINHFDDLFPAESTQECSVCHAEQGLGMIDENFCPNCGADMRGEQNENG